MGMGYLFTCDSLDRQVNHRINRLIGVAEFTEFVGQTLICVCFCVFFHRKHVQFSLNRINLADSTTIAHCCAIYLCCLGGEI